MAEGTRLRGHDDRWELRAAEREPRPNLKQKPQGNVGDWLGEPTWKTGNGNGQAGKQHRRQKIFGKEKAK